MRVATAKSSNGSVDWLEKNFTQYFLCCMMGICYWQVMRILVVTDVETIYKDVFLLLFLFFLWGTIYKDVNLRLTGL